MSTPEVTPKKAKDSRSNIPFSDILPRITDIHDKASVWEIKETIGQLSYLTHNYFRYYGKFPSTLPAQLLEQYELKKGQAVLDNYSGSGTTLVEASRRKIQSVGIDLSPLAILSARVKTQIYDTELLLLTLDSLSKYKENLTGNTETAEFFESALWSHKWFAPTVIADLYALRKAIIDLGHGPCGDFFSLAFTAVVRRVSFAFDGEVRPHINQCKKQRDVFSAFTKKCHDMIARQKEFNFIHPDRIPATAFLSDSSIDYSSKIPDANYKLVISHPPYLNCFDYLQVYSLELLWSDSMPCVWHGTNLTEFRSRMRPSEVKTTVKSPKDVDSYYAKLRDAYSVTYKIQSRGGICAIVIGDCKIKSAIESVHTKIIPILEEVGYRFDRINYRETHYATGKYSYDFRADYHGNAAEKRDAIVIFRK